MSLAALLNPALVKVSPQQARERLDFDAVGTVLAEQVVNNEQTGDSDTKLVPIDGMKNISCRVYPIESRDRVPTFETGRIYTDKVLLNGFYPRANSSQYVRVTRTSGEQVVYEIIDVGRDGNDERTELLTKARFDRS